MEDLLNIIYNPVMFTIILILLIGAICFNIWLMVDDGDSINTKYLIIILLLVIVTMFLLINIEGTVEKYSEKEYDLEQISHDLMDKKISVNIIRYTNAEQSDSIVLYKKRISNTIYANYYILDPKIIRPFEINYEEYKK